MSFYHGLRETPTYARKDYLTHYKEKCILVEKAASTWYFGTGISPAAHPLAHVVPMSSHNCKNCGFIHWFGRSLVNRTLSG